MISTQMLLNELQSLAGQRETILAGLASVEVAKEVIANLHRIEGAEKMCRHLLARGQVAEGAGPPARNGAVTEGAAVED